VVLLQMPKHVDDVCARLLPAPVQYLLGILLAGLGQLALHSLQVLVHLLS
jgi:hypothetical protein